MHAKRVVLKPGKEKAIRHRHHWIFSGAVASMPEGDEGALWPVYSSNGQLLGSAYFNQKVNIVGRMVAFGEISPHDAIRQHLEQAVALRERLFRGSDTNAYRLVNAEGDLLPGLIVDRYDQVLAIQISTLGMDRLRPFIVEELQRLIKPRSIYEKSHMSSRREEGLTDVQGLVLGESVDEVEIRENGLRFLVSIAEGQKTGFFLDHREMRVSVKEMAKDKRVLNCFAYTGGFSIYAAAGGAKLVESVDLSAQAIAWARKNDQLNGFGTPDSHFHVADVFEFLRQRDLPFDLVILDPPAFAKKQRDVIAACRGYKEINRVAMQKMPKGSLLLTSSCSYHVDA
ncbi:MAG: class I SAM-dependent rRNA methyltransferase, partial [Parachlamydia sp.]|nr:class I SAM-dependent rRNA methyltransferase [Parachlamydia sp.]